MNILCHLNGHAHRIAFDKQMFFLLLGMAHDATTPPNIKRNVDITSNFPIQTASGIFLYFFFFTCHSFQFVFSTSSRFMHMHIIQSTLNAMNRTGTTIELYQQTAEDNWPNSILH